MYFECGADWYDRMKSLKATAEELAIAPELDPEESDIVSLLVETGQRMTTTQILSAFEQRGRYQGRKHRQAKARPINETQNSR